MNKKILMFGIVMLISASLFSVGQYDGLVSGKRSNVFPLTRKIEIKYVVGFVGENGNPMYNLEDVGSPNTRTIWYLGDETSAYEAWGDEDKATSSLMLEGYHLFDARLECSSVIRLSCAGQIQKA